MDKETLIQFVSQAKNGDAEAIGALYEKYRDVAYSIAMRETKSSALSDDIVQETFIEVIQKIGDLQTPEAFPAWLKTIAYHQCTRHYKKKESVHESQASENEEGFSVFDTQEEKNSSFIPDEALDQKEFRETILAMVDNLPDVQRSALYMFYYDDLPLKAIAQAQGVSVNTANTRLNRGRKAMKGSIEQYEKKHGTRLHTIVFFPFFKWLLSGSEETMSASSSATVAQNISAATGVPITTTGAAAGATSAAVTTAAATAGAKLAAIPLAAKVISGIAAVAVALGISAVVGNMEETPATEPLPTESVVENQTEMTETESVNCDVFYEHITEQYQDAIEHNLGRSPETGMWLKDYELGEYVNELVSLASSQYSNYGGMDSAEFHIYYALVDLNSDGCNEYFIGAGTSLEDARIFDVFSLENGKPIRIVEGDTLGERSTMTIYDDMSFEIHASGGSVYNMSSFYILEKGETDPTLQCVYEQDGENTFYYTDSSENRTPINEQKYLDGIAYARLPEYRMPWTLISSAEESGRDTATEPEVTEPPTEPRVNLVDTFTQSQQRAVNIFLSNFAEAGLGTYPADDVDLLNFAYEHISINPPYEIEYIENDQARFSADDVDAVLKRFFGHSISHRTMQNSFGSHFEYRDGCYYTPAADGDGGGLFSVAHEMYQNEDGTYDVTFAIYYEKIEYAPGIIGYSADPTRYYVLSPMDIADHPELVKTGTGTAILRAIEKTDGSVSYQLSKLDVTVG